MAKRAASKPKLRTIRVFIASPNDLAVERRAFKDVIDELNTGFGDGAKMKFEPLGWEETLATTGRRPQSVINVEVDRCDVFVLALYARWGQAVPDDQPYSSYTQEEFHRALDRWKQTAAPEIFVFFKHVTPREMGDPGPQLQKVLDFRKSLEESRQVLYRGFANEAEFKAEVDRHLRAFAKGELPKTDAPRDKVLLPLAVLAEVQKEKAEKEQALARAEQANQKAEAAVARAETFALEFAERASKAALEGRVEEAQQDFAKATDSTTNLRVLNLAYQFYDRTGDLTAAEEMLERRLAISGRDTETRETASSLGSLGWVYRQRGKLNQAEEMHQKSLALFKKLGHQHGIANQYGCLGLIYRTRGELDRAEEMFKMELFIHDKLGRQGDMAGVYGNLGVIYEMRGELDRAEAMQQKSLVIAEKLGRPETIADAYSRLALVYQTQGTLDRAEEMYQKALAINEKLCRQEGMANDYCNLGLIYQTRGELDRAEEMHQKALTINEKLGHQEGMAADYCNLGLIYWDRGDLDRSAGMHKKSLAIQEKLGLQEGMAIQYSNLGSVAEDRGELERARELWTKARDLYAKIGMPHMVKRVRGWLDGMPLTEAKE